MEKLIKIIELTVKIVKIKGIKIDIEEDRIIKVLVIIKRMLSSLTSRLLKQANKITINR